jgi:integrase
MHTSKQFWTRLEIILICYPIMASIHRVKGKPNWFCAFRIYLPDGTTRRCWRSTMTRDKAAAKEICNAWHRAALRARKGKLNEDSARAIIAAGVSDVLLTVSAESLPSASIKAWGEKWAAARAVEVSEATHARYERVLERFTAFLGDKAKRDIATLTASDVARFRDNEAKELSRATVNLSLKILRICFGEAVRQELITANPAARVKLLKSSGDSKRRDFTLDEIRRILAVCGDNHEWRGLVLFGLYTGQRLGDLARLTWRAVNFHEREIAFTTRKTGRRILLPLVQPLLDYFATRKGTHDANAPIFPRAAKHKRTASLSNQFREILVEAGLAAPLPRGHASTGKGRSAPREASEISFHSLRHSAVTMLKAAGVSDFFAREIIGHESAAVSRQYSHLTLADKRTAMAKLPDVTKERWRGSNPHETAPPRERW